MSEDFVTMLRERVDAVAPVIDVDTSRVVPRARRRRAVVRTTALAVAAGLVVTGAAWATGGGRGITPPAGGFEVREDAGEVTEGWPDAPFWHVAYEELDITGAVTARRDVWYGRDEPGVGLVDGEPAWAMGPASWGALKLGGEYLEGDHRVLEGGWTLVTWDVLYELPADPKVLEQALRASIEPGRGSGTDDDKVFDMLVDMLRGSPAPPSLRLALWEVAAGLDGTELHQDVWDSRGRRAMIDRSRTDGDGAGQYFYDPDDGRLLEILEMPAPEDVAAAQEAGDIVMGWNAVYLEEGPAESTPVEPTLELAGCVAWETC